MCTAPPRTAHGAVFVIGRSELHVGFGGRRFFFRMRQALREHGLAGDRLGGGYDAAELDILYAARGGISAQRADRHVELGHIALRRVAELRLPVGVLLLRIRESSRLQGDSVIAIISDSAATTVRRKQISFIDHSLYSLSNASESCSVTRLPA